MGRTLTLLVLIILTLSSFIGYYYLTQKVTAGNLKIAAGQLQLAEGQKKLAQGKARLARGESQLSGAKKAYSLGRTSMLTAVLAPVAAPFVFAGDEMMKGKINQGNRQVAEGRAKIRVGEQRLKEGQLQLQEGIKQLKMINSIRWACLTATVIFAFLLVVFGVFLRKR